HDRRYLRRQFSYFANPALLGPQPVDEDRDGSLAREAVQGHLANFRMPDFITEFKCRDDALPYDPNFTAASFSPYNYLDQIPKDVAVYAISGWMEPAMPTALCRASSPCPIRNDACCWGRGTTARASMSRHGGHGRSRNSPCWARCCVSSTSISRVATQAS